MTDATARVTTATPWHLWVVGLLSLLWSGYGGYDYIMTMVRGEAYLRSAGFDQAMIDWVEALPDWTTIPWALGVWGAVLGSLLLLIRNRLAVWAFGLSLVGAVASLVYGQWINPPPPPPAAMAWTAYLHWVIVAIAVFLVWYAWAMSKKGVLR